MFLFCLFLALTDKLCLLFVDSAFEAVAPRLQAYIKVPLFPGIPALPDPSGAVCADSRYALHATPRACVCVCALKSEKWVLQAEDSTGFASWP